MSGFLIQQVINKKREQQLSIVVVLFFVLFSNRIHAQRAEKFIEKAEEAFLHADYYAAASYYSSGIEKYPDNLKMKFGYAESLRQYNDYINAAKAYKDVITDDDQKKYPLSSYWYAVMLRQQGKYDFALKQLEKLKNAYRGKDDMKDRIVNQIASCKWAIEHNKDSSSLKIIHLEAPVNTPYSEFHPFTDGNNQLYFSSLRKPEKDKNYLARFYSLQDSLSLFINNINKTTLTQKHIANGSLTDDGNEFFFTICDDDAKRNCKIYFSTKASEWSKAEEVWVQNSDEYTNTQPFLATYPNKESYLYFVSNRPKGKGGTDIWVAKRNGKNSYEQPIPQTDVNTAENEYSPFFDSDSNLLYFSSEGLIGFGGVDIYKWSLNSPLPQNMGNKVNSPANDFGYRLSADRTQAYFASNRKGAFFIKAETCCYDIWNYATGRQSQKKLPETSIVLKDTASIKVTSTTVVKQETQDATTTLSVAIDLSDTATNTILRIAKSNTGVTKMKALLPVTLYFHNDEPECCNLRDTTALNYVNTYERYWRLLYEYKHNFAGGLLNNEKVKAEKEVFDLFTYKVEKGYHDLIQFSAQLIDALQAGKKIAITIQGYCSPLNYNEYNIKLGYRRIASLKNYFYAYRSGVLKPFIDNGLLILKNESIGEEQASKTVSDSREDTRNSVYHPAAALERRVEIISIELE